MHIRYAFMGGLVRSGVRGLLERLKKERGFLHETHSLLAANDPDYLRAYDNLFRFVMTSNRLLSTKTKELLVISVLCSRGSYEGARLHMKRAIQKGATPSEVLESIETAALYSGAPTLIYGGEALIQTLTGLGMISTESKTFLPKSGRSQGRLTPHR